MDMMQLLRTNLAAREFSDREVPADTILDILEAGRIAHSSKNSQPWRFIVIKDKEKLARLSRTSPTAKHLAKAPFAIALFMEGAKLPEVDGARAMEDMMLYAWSVGIASCWITNFDEEKVKDILNAPTHWKLVTVAPFGYPAKPPKKGRKRRKPIEELAYFETYKRPINELQKG